jgi:exonuclease SbcD
MRILHTSDWHLGRSFHRVGMLDAQAAYLDHLVDVVRAERVDVVVVAGDVFDRALPAVDVVQLLDDGLDRLLDTGAKVLLTSGNHDSAVRLGFGGRRSARAGLHVRTRASDSSVPVLLSDHHGEVALYGIPYLEPALVADEMACDRTHQGVLSAAMTAVRADLARRPGVRSLVAAHAFVTGGVASESERDISVGGVGAVPVSVFDGVDYVALGHLHGPQALADTVRYSGSPLPYSFSERTHRKRSWLVELDIGSRGDSRGLPRTRVVEVETPVHRRLASLRGRLEDLLTDDALSDHEDAFCQVVLTDAVRPRDPMERLRRRFPHTLTLSFEPEGVVDERSYAARVEGLGDLDLCCSFVAHVRGAEPDDDERELLRDALEAGRIQGLEAPKPMSPGAGRSLTEQAREGAA